MTAVQTDNRCPICRMTCTRVQRRNDGTVRALPAAAPRGNGGGGNGGGNGINGNVLLAVYSLGCIGAGVVGTVVIGSVLAKKPATSNPVVTKDAAMASVKLIHIGSRALVKALCP